METKQILAVIEGLGLLVATYGAYAGNAVTTAVGLGIAGILRLADEFV